MPTTALSSVAVQLCKRRIVDPLEVEGKLMELFNDLMRHPSENTKQVRGSQHGVRVEDVRILEGARGKGEKCMGVWQPV